LHTLPYLRVHQRKLKTNHLVLSAGKHAHRPWEDRAILLNRDTCLLLQKNHPVSSDVEHSVTSISSGIQLYVSRGNITEDHVYQDTQDVNPSLLFGEYSHIVPQTRTLLLIGLSVCRSHGNQTQMMSLGYKRRQKIAAISGNVSFGLNPFRSYVGPRPTL
jgi:hypothetical protein